MQEGFERCDQILFLYGEVFSKLNYFERKRNQTRYYLRLDSGQQNSNFNELSEYADETFSSIAVVVFIVRVASIVAINEDN